MTMKIKKSLLTDANLPVCDAIYTFQQGHLAKSHLSKPRVLGPLRFPYMESRVDRKLLA